VSDEFLGGSVVVDQARLWQRLQASLIIALSLLFGLGGLVLAIAPSSEADDWLPLRIFLVSMGALGLWGVVVGIRTFRARIEINAVYVTLHRARGKLRVPLHDVIRVMLVDAPGRRDDVEAAAQRANESLAAFKTVRDWSSH
jgi:hypothetical protein